MNLDLAKLHDRYRVQARWTEELRQNLLDRIGLPSNALVLEVGSGTGCITSWMSTVVTERVLGIDIDQWTVQYAHDSQPDIGYAQADGYALPFPTDSFDLNFCHFLLLWTADPAQILAEMKRCTRPGGWVIAFAEPDYRGRIDYPEALDVIGRHQAEALRQRGAVLTRGRALRALFSSTGLVSVTAGVLGGEWGADSHSEYENEWSVIWDDLSVRLTPGEIAELEARDRSAWEEQQRILFTPTFYAIGQKSG